MVCQPRVCTLYIRMHLEILCLSPKPYVLEVVWYNLSIHNAKQFIEIAWFEDYILKINWHHLFTL